MARRQWRRPPGNGAPNGLPGITPYTSNRIQINVRHPNPPTLAIVVPCFDEAAVLDGTIESLLGLLDRLAGDGQVAPASRLLLVDDGSRDASWSLITTAGARDRRVHGLRLAVNAGHQSALLAGLSRLPASVDCAVTIDADLQDDIDAIGAMVERYRAGDEIVCAVNRERDSDSWFKRTSARAFYRLLGLLGIEVVPDHADFRLLGRGALDRLAEFPEYHLYLRGLVSRLGGPLGIVEQARRPRRAGASKYTLGRMLALAWDGITSFSIAPLRILTALGALIFLFSTAMGVHALVGRLQGDVVPGWASTVLPIYFLGGIQLLAIGIVGEYLGKIYLEVKRRPRFLVAEQTGDEP